MRKARGPTGTQQSHNGRVRVMLSIKEDTYRALVRMAEGAVRSLSGQVEFLIVKEDSREVRSGQDRSEDNHR